MRLAVTRITLGGELIIDAHRYRTQEQNRQDAIERLEALVARCSVPPKKRHRTRPTRSSVEKRLEAKRQRSQIKQNRARDE